MGIVASAGVTQAVRPSKIISDPSVKVSRERPAGVSISISACNMVLPPNDTSMLQARASCVR